MCVSSQGPLGLVCIVAILTAASCRRAPAEGDTFAPVPWSDLPRVPLNPFRELIDTSLGDAVAPVAIVSGQTRPFALVLDPSAGRVHVLDSRYHHRGARDCVRITDWEDLAGSTHQGRCDSGEVEVGWGRMKPSATPVAVAIDETRLVVGVLGVDRRLYEASADATTGNPFDFMRLDDGSRLDLPMKPAPGSTLLAIDDGEVWVGQGSEVHRFAADGAPIDSLPVYGTIRGMAVVAGVPWVATDLEVRAGDRQVDDEGGADVAVGGEDVWVSRPDHAELVHFHADGSQTRVSVEGLTGPIAVDPSSGRVYAAVGQGVAVVDGEAEVARYDTAHTVVDLGLNPAHEIQVIEADGSVVVYVDETALSDVVEDGAPPVDLAIAAFVEQPRDAEHEFPCHQGRARGSLEEVVQTALANRKLLADLPSTVALGIIPHAARRIDECGLTDEFRPVWDAPRTEPGILFHAQPDCTTGGPVDQSCYDDWFSSTIDDWETLGARSGWSSGLGSHGDSGLDWVGGLKRAGMPDRYLFYGMTLLSGIDHDSDPRAKDPWPLDLASLSAAWRANSAGEAATGSTSGWLVLYPGDNVPVYILGGCADEFVAECQRAKRGGGTAIDDGDIAVLDLLLHRALAAPSAGGPRSFTFHLPDIGTYDYTAGCTVEGRVWSGDCSGARLQRWAFDVQQRFVLGGLAHWTLPSDLAEP